MLGSEDRTVLVVDDDENILKTLERFLSSEGFSLIVETSPEKALEIAKSGVVEIVISDINMPEMDGLELLNRLLKVDPRMMVIMITAVGTERLAVDAMKAGAFHYLAKPLNLDELSILIKRASEKLELLHENEVLKSERKQGQGLNGMIGNSAELEHVKQLTRTVSESDVTVLITGESGTGKELVAESLHRLSKRAKGPFVKINCAAIPENLLESELFGYEKGAFTDACARRVGKFELADGGSIFLDEVGDMSPSTQTKLLRVLQEQEIERIGGKKTIKINTRVIAATNRDLALEISQGRFREDLFYRLNVIEIPIPPLRDRKADIPLLAQYFIDHFSLLHGKKRITLTKTQAQQLCNYHWPGNIRELKNQIERAVILGLNKSTEFGTKEKSRYDRAVGTKGNFRSEEEIPQLRELQKEHIKYVLEFTEGNKTRAARILGIDPKTLRSKLE